MAAAKATSTMAQAVSIWSFPLAVLHWTLVLIEFGVSCAAIFAFTWTCAMLIERFSKSDSSPTNSTTTTDLAAQASSVVLPTAPTSNSATTNVNIDETPTVSPIDEAAPETDADKAKAPAAKDDTPAWAAFGLVFSSLHLVVSFALVVSDTYGDMAYPLLFLTSVLGICVFFALLSLGFFGIMFVFEFVQDACQNGYRKRAGKKAAQDALYEPVATEDHELEAGMAKA